MSLKNVDITKVNRLSLKEVKLPAPDVKVDPIPLEIPPSDEEIVYNKLVAINPIFEKLVNTFDLVSIKTGERISKVELKENIKPPPAPEIKVKDIDRPKLIALAQKVIERGNSYSKEEIIARIKKATNVSQERAEIGFSLILQAGGIDNTLRDSYYLTGSTPF